MKYYKVGFSEENYKEFEVKDVAIKEGTILFFDDAERTAVHAIIPSGKWTYLQAVNKNSAINVVSPTIAPREEYPNAFQIKSTESVSVQSEAGSSEGVCSEDAKGKEAPEKS